MEVGNGDISTFAIENVTEILLAARNDIVSSFIFSISNPS